MRRLVYGCLAGLAASVPMTATMARLRQRLPDADRYELPPAELTAGAGFPHSPAATMVAHFAYGALTGALFGLQKRRSPILGAAFGVGVWSASYLGWIPLSGLLAPATRHPRPRVALMLIAHVVWGASLASAQREIEGAEDGFTGRRLPASAPAARERGTR